MSPAVSYHERVEIEVLAEPELGSIRPLLLSLLLDEAGEAGSPASRQRLDLALPQTRSTFKGENHVFAAREAGQLLGFCWCVLFDPGTGLEGEVAELYVLPEARGRGVAGQLLREATRLFSHRRVTFAAVWTDHGNEAAVRAYRKVGFAPTQQLVMTWYGDRDSG